MNRILDALIALAAWALARSAQPAPQDNDAIYF